MAAVLFSIGAAISYGAADFLGGLASRRAGAPAVVLLSQLVGLILLVPALLVMPGTEVAAGLGWGAVAGIAGGTGVLLLYRGLARGRMSVVAPITAVEAAAVPVVFALVAGERPGPLALVGAVVAVIAIVLISSAQHELEPALGSDNPVGTNGQVGASGVLEAIGAGLSFGVFFILLDRASAGSGLWPLLGTKATSIPMAGALLLLSGTRLRAEGPARPQIAWAGVLDMSSNLLFLLAVRSGLLSLVAVVTAMYPASTVVLARVVLRERLKAAQLLGLALAAGAVVLLALG